jgi:O-antigen ligase
MLRLRWRWLNVAGWLVIAGLIVCIFLSASRSGMINLLLMGVYFFSRIGIPMRRFVITSLFLGIFGLLVMQVVPSSLLPMSSEDAVRKAVTSATARGNIPSAYLDRITNFVTASRGSGVEVSTENRLDLALTGLRMFVDHPLLGVGVGNFRWRSIVDYHNPHVSALHNSYVLTLTEGGLVMMVGYVILFTVILKVLAEARHRSAEQPEVGLAWLVEGTQVMFVMFLIFSAFADCWHEAYLPFLAALTTVLARLYDPAANGHAARTAPANAEPAPGGATA